ncbi:hypothetical protein SAMN05660909_01326 [Chitinophaga terrae (ex Kim and Jung 2007)]|uniref:Uncharacterized protein n=1 Tax=Chitinophaga terrae (ex Kim and Jung 2007) TaxID=408074 RepID=A0A1H3ZWX4_9BACT|nr:hypothetical protein [Chitinophaga terrae (ex Kim and Jung 2007)]MDQ0106167.1 hypothetical protein [Chitinophaga terrae (ex Kim and Jung 2007)]GEP93132.1 hypothetical protein CTE07_47770 [Chitinophaga terrae (ex Kim and Jung 2007)]SEA27792.1 hypothetical protein SAMN05660909_01326 [Chitinophaga terrae (ex Kim and Jung 2007)]
MKYFLYLLLLLPIQESKINAIKSKVSHTNTQLTNYRQQQLQHEPGSATEGAVSVAYFSNDSLKLITHDLYGERGKEIAHYYFDDQQLIYAHVITHAYNAPISDKQFDYKKSRKNEGRYYYHNNSLIKGGKNGNGAMAAAKELAAKVR